MGALRFLLWTVACVALGIFLATFRVEGKTPWDRAVRAWHSSGTQAVGALSEKAAETYENAKDALAQDGRPHEHHTDGDRDALNKLIAKRSTQK